MPDEVRTLLHDAAGHPLPDVDLVAVERRSRGRRRRDRLVRAFGAVAVLAALAIAGIVSVGGGESRPQIAVRTPTTLAPASTFDAAGDTVDLPAGWYRASQPLVSYLTDPREILSAATLPLDGFGNGAGPGCDAQLPKATLDAMGPTDAFVWLVQSPRGGVIDAGRTFPDRPGRFTLDQFQSFDCSAPEWTFPHQRFSQFWFSVGDRLVGAYLVLGDQVTVERRQEVLSLLDSLGFAPPEPAAETGPKPAPVDDSPRAVELSAVDDALATQAADAYGGLEVSRRTLVVHVLRTGQRRVRAIVDAALSTVPGRPPLRVVYRTATTTLTTLDHRATLLGDNARLLESRGVELSEWGPDVRHNTLSVGVVNLTDRARRAIEAIVGADHIEFHQQGPVLPIARRNGP